MLAQHPCNKGFMKLNKYINVKHSHVNNISTEQLLNFVFFLGILHLSGNSPAPSSKGWPLEQ